MKYVVVGTSSNFGNMFSAAVAAVVLSFLPMLPGQILLNNLLYDTGQLAIPGDRVDTGTHPDADHFGHVDQEGPVPAQPALGRPPGRLPGRGGRHRLSPAVPACDVLGFAPLPVPFFLALLAMIVVYLRWCSRSFSSWVPSPEPT